MKNILITGASGNLGQAVVKKFLSEGHRVIATVAHGTELPFKTSDELATIASDLSNEVTVNGMIGDIVTRYATIDAALLLVGGWSGGTIADTDGIALKKMFSLNFETAYYVARPVFRQMMQQPAGGRIVFIGARPALQAKDGKTSLAYGLSKSLVFKLSEYLNAEGAHKNVVSSVVVPSTIDTVANRAAMPKADFNSWVKPEAIADVISFLVSDHAAALRDPVVKVYGNS
ncbi:MAG TPA: SDR family NAD(P)-dependent oxidoreductase [Cyclobacteriaceae bacterium]|nr:SDR family NAD(P)-dependent oxidoreductase [Cyclobacteriaceae bacterium]